MADFEAVKVGNLKNVFKNKKSVLIFAGLGAAAGGVALLMNRGKNEEPGELLPASQTGPIYPSSSSGDSPDIIEMMGSLQQSFTEALGDYDALQQQRTAVLIDQLSQNFENPNQATLSLLDEVTRQMIASQESINNQWASLNSRIENLAALPPKEVYQQPTSNNISNSSSGSGLYIYNSDGNYYGSYEEAGRASQKQVAETGTAGGGGVTKDFYQANKSVFTPEEQRYYNTAFGM